MRLLLSVSATVLLASTFAIAQAQEPGSAPEQTAPPAAASARARTGGGPPLVKADPSRPEQAGRNALYKYLDDIATQQTAARRATVAKITTRAQAEARQRMVRAKILALMGGLPEKTPLNARVLGSTQLSGFRIEKVLYDSQPNFPVTALLYLPDQKISGQKLPAIVMAPGHIATGKASDFALASTFARNGFAVLSYDPIGQGERLQYPDPAHPGVDLATKATGEHGEASLQVTLIGDAVARYFAWDGMRAVDYLLTRPEIDPTRIGAEGCSGGGAMTALLGALDNRIVATGTACYTTNYDALLPITGPQDAEQSIPNFVASGLDFPDWVELAAPRHYAIIGTVSDMFPWAGLIANAQESRRFYALFDPSAAGTPTGAPMPPTPTGPTLNPDTPNSIPPTASLQVIAGIGGHGNLGPITSQIVSFFLVNLAHSDATPIVPPPAPRGAGAGANPFGPPAGVPAGALQVTATGQVATSYPGSATVFSLNLKHAAVKLPAHRARLTLLQLQAEVREVTKAGAIPISTKSCCTTSKTVTEVNLDHSLTDDSDGTSEIFGVHVTLHEKDGFDLAAIMVGHESKGASPKGMLLVEPNLGITTQNGPPSHDLLARMLQLAHQGYNVLAVTPRPSPPGNEEIKSPILGPFYMSELRAEITGKTILGMRVDDILTATDYLAYQISIYPQERVHPVSPITAIASGHMGLVLLHAAVLDPRLKHITIDHTLESYDSLLKAPMPLDAPQDILPGVLLHYDIPDLIRVLGPRVTFTDPLPGTANLASPDTPTPTLR